MEALIPEWKRGAVVLITADDLLGDKPSIFETAKNKLKAHIKTTEAYKTFRESSQFKDYQEFREDLKIATANVKEGLEMSQNPLIMMSRDILDRVSFKSSSAEATMIMRKFDPNFNLLDFEKEVDVTMKFDI